MERDLPTRLKSGIAALRGIPNGLTAEETNAAYVKENEILFAEVSDILFPRFEKSSYPKQGQSLWRMTIPCFDDFDPSQIKYFREPPVAVCKRGRCNIPLHPVFYCSMNPKFSIIEVLQGSLEMQKKAFLTEWEVSESRNWSTLGMFLDDIPNSNPFFDAKEIYLPAFVTLLKETMSDQQQVEYRKILNEEFMKAGDHKFASLVSVDFLYGPDSNGDVVLYPSSQGNKYDCNLAFNYKHLENNTITFKRGFILENLQMIMRGNTPTFQFQCQSSVSNKSEPLNWQPTSDEEKRLLYTILGE